MEAARAIAATARRLEEAGSPSPAAEAEALLAHALGLDRAALHARAPALEPRAAAWLDEAVARREGGEPLQHILGEVGFHDLVLEVRPGVFIPRPETEVLVERCLEILEAIRAPVVVDVGTGSGAVALALARSRPDARVLATDSSPDAIALAGENASRLGAVIDARVGDLFAPLPPDLRGGVDLVVSNPPYVTEEEYPDLPAEVRADPREALVGGTELHARLAAEAPAWLRPGGWLAMEIGETQGQEVAGLLAGWREVAVLPDLAGRDRIVIGSAP